MFSWKQAKNNDTLRYYVLHMLLQILQWGESAAMAHSPVSNLRRI